MENGRLCSVGVLSAYASYGQSRARMCQRFDHGCLFGGTHRTQPGIEQRLRFGTGVLGAGMQSRHIPTLAPGRDERNRLVALIDATLSGLDRHGSADSSGHRRDSPPRRVAFGSSSKSAGRASLGRDGGI